MMACAINENATRFLCDHGFASDFVATRIEGGANNQVYRVEDDSKVGLLKLYFRHPDDPRDRLGAEFSFCEFAWTNGLRWTPQPLALDTSAGCGLYEFIPGRSLDPSEITWARVDEAIRFFRDINQLRKEALEQKLPLASEACFSLKDHLACVDRRMDRLGRVGSSSDLDRDAEALIRDRLVPAWTRIRASVAKGPNLDVPLPREQWCLSPSDFGFHNAVLTAKDRLRFFDFEYAGWDDPAKTLCDFFCQPKLPIPNEFYSLFGNEIGDAVNDGGDVVAHAEILLPVYQVKWCCIMLNEFLPTDSRRRAFALDAEELESRREKQLMRVSAELDHLN